MGRRFFIRSALQFGALGRFDMYVCVLLRLERFTLTHPTRKMNRLPGRCTGLQQVRGALRGSSKTSTSCVSGRKERPTGLVCFQRGQRVSRTPISARAIPTADTERTYAAQCGSHVDWLARRSAHVNFRLLFGARTPSNEETLKRERERERQHQHLAAFTSSRHRALRVSNSTSATVHVQRVCLAASQSGSSARWGCYCSNANRRKWPRVEVLLFKCIGNSDPRARARACGYQRVNTSIARQSMTSLRRRSQDLRFFNGA